jgi:hypothetical protein
MLFFGIAIGIYIWYTHTTSSSSIAVFLDIFVVFAIILFNNTYEFLIRDFITVAMDVLFFIHIIPTL